MEQDTTLQPPSLNGATADDYGAEAWPDVQRYVDDEVEPLDFVERIGHEWQTCVYRVR